MGDLKCKRTRKQQETTFLIHSTLALSLTRAQCQVCPEQKGDPAHSYKDDLNGLEFKKAKGWHQRFVLFKRCVQVVTEEMFTARLLKLQWSSPTTAARQPAPQPLPGPYHPSHAKSLTSSTCNGQQVLLHANTFSSLLSKREMWGLFRKL